MIALKKFIYIFAFIGLCSLVSGCEDRAVASSNNMIRAINKVISNEEVMIAIPCMSLRDDKVVPPFVIIDPMLKELRSWKSQGQLTLKSLVLKFICLLWELRSLMAMR